MWIVALSPLAIVLAMSFGQGKFSTGTLQADVLGLCGADGPVDVDDLPASIPADRSRRPSSPPPAAFAGLSLFGYTTKKDLIGHGQLPDHGRGRAVVAMLINMFAAIAQA